MKVFAITVAHNEDFFLDRWEAYHGAQLGHENLFVIDHGSTDLSVARLRAACPVNVLRVPRTTFSDAQRARAVAALHESLLEYFDAGFVTDCDEFLVVDPAKFDGLRSFAQEVAAAGSATAIGLNLVHMPDIEPPFQAHIPIMAQRRHLRFETAMCKTAFASRKGRWSGGFHGSSFEPSFRDGFYLFHLKLFDHAWRLVRQGVSRGWDWAGNHGQHVRGPDSDVERRSAEIIHRRTHLGVVEDFDFSAQIRALGAVTRKTVDGLFVFDRPDGPIDPSIRLAPEWTRLLF